jgi:hypothetical protein
MRRLGNALCARVIATACALLLGAIAARGDQLKIENATVAPRDAATATVKFDISWEDSWRHGSFHDSAWVFFKVRGDDKSGWQPLRLAADKVVNPTGYGQQKGGTPLEFVVPPGDDGLVGTFVRRAVEGKGPVAAQGVAAVWDLAANRGIPKDLKGVSIRAFGIEMVYVAEGPFYLGSGGTELNRFFQYTDGSQDRQPYRVTIAGRVPTGRQQGKLWATGIAPEDKGEIPASFPNGYAAFYCMKYFITQGQYADFLNTLTETQARGRFHIAGHGHWINRVGESPNYIYSASGRPPNDYFRPRATERDQRCPWLSWADGAALAAWAGLRPMTELEYEKACRGPLQPAPNEQGPSYWGVVELNGGLVYERPVSAGSAVGRKFAGTHGRGTPMLPADWPADVGAAVFRGDYLHGRQYSSVGHLRVSGRMNAVDVRADRGTHPFAGWRGARTAPAGDTAMLPVSGRLDAGTVRPVARLRRPVRVDSVPDGWGKPALVLSGPADLFLAQSRFAPVDFYGRLLRPWQGPEDLGAKVYLGWDGEALCVAAEVTDDRHFNTKTGDAIVNGDALHLGLATASGATWNLGLALTKEGVVFHQWEGKGDALLKTVDCSLTRDDKTRITRYGLRLPLATLNVESGEEFRLNIVFYDDDDGAGFRHWLQLAPGLAPGLPRGGASASVPTISGKTAQFPRFVLEK